MERMIIVSDYIEGQPVVASVRYQGIMNYLAQDREIIVINNENLGFQNSDFASVNYKYSTTKAKFTQDFTKQDVQRVTVIEKILRTPFILSIWRNYKYSKSKFNKKNESLYLQIDECLDKNQVKAILVTVPDIYNLYILEYIKKKYPNIPAVVEVRDILNHSIGKGNPSHAYKKAEKMMLNYADGIIALSKGIYEHYKTISPHKNIKIIRNGYDHELLSSCQYEPLVNKREITLAHIGSIYKGRNIKDFVQGLLKFHEETGIKVIFNIVGILDKEALEDINSMENNEGIELNIIGTVPHKEAIQYLKECDVSVIITHKEGSGYAIPGKTFEYIGACKPILAITEDFELVSFISSKYGECAKHEASDVANKLDKIIKSEYDFSDRLEYSRKKQVEKIIDYLKDVKS
ncbi:glycosyltransferase [Bacillus sp. FSL R10-2789]|uniref:glycosyltransferase n=1 Tax=Bacillus sp. FSL R10-2789 TaxID=2954662 RepID=UPI0030F7DB07